MTGNRPDPPLPLVRLLSCLLTLPSLCGQLLSPNLDRIKLSRHRVGLCSLNSLCGLQGRNRTPPRAFWEEAAHLLAAHLNFSQDQCPSHSPLPAFPKSAGRSQPRSLSISHSQIPNPLGIRTEDTHQCQQAAPERALLRQRHHCRARSERLDHRASSEASSNSKVPARSPAQERGGVFGYQSRRAFG